MGEIIFIVGGARSGKSTLAAGIAKKHGKVAVIATGEPKDCEMKARIAKHRKNRPSNWKTIEEPVDIASALDKTGDKFACVLIDCLTLWISNMMGKGYHDKRITAEAKSLLRTARKKKSLTILVSNEVGLGIVPENKMARDFRDTAGIVNQLTARQADKVYFTVSGIPLLIKGAS